MKMSRSMDIVNHQPMPDSGVDVKSTKQLTALGYWMPEQTESNDTGQYNTGSFPNRVGKGAKAKRN